MPVKAYAKVNFTLEVLGSRSDSYHEVRTVLQTIDLADTLQFSPGPRLRLESTSSEVETDDNLVLKAANALRRATGCGKGANISLEKRIPIAAGLGGGSSDAAATLMGLSDLWELDISDGELRSIAATLGSDVPFFLRGGTALGKGRGEQLVYLPPLSPRWMVVLCTSSQSTQSDVRRGGKTARLYSMLTPQEYNDGSRTHELVEAVKNGRFSRELLCNVFEGVAPLAFPGFEGARQHFLEEGVSKVHLSGTGPAMYALVSSKNEGEEVSKSLKNKGLEAYCVSTLRGDT